VVVLDDQNTVEDGAVEEVEDRALVERRVFDLVGGSAADDLVRSPLWNSGTMLMPTVAE
jgi:hypothetical protein